MERQNTAGIKINETQSVDFATIFYGKSLVDELDEFLDSSLKSSGLINSGKFEINSKLDEFNQDLLDVDDKIASFNRKI